MIVQPITGYLLKDEQGIWKAFVSGTNVYPLGIACANEDLAAMFNGGDALPLLQKP